MIHQLFSFVLFIFFKLLTYWLETRLRWLLDIHNVELKWLIFLATIHKNALNLNGGCALSPTYPETYQAQKCTGKQSPSLGCLGISRRLSLPWRWFLCPNQKVLVSIASAYTLARVSAALAIVSYFVYWPPTTSVFATF